MVQMARLKNVPCTNKPQKILLLIMHVVFLRIFSFLWIILITHPGHTNLFLESVTIKFIGQGCEGREK